MLAACTALGVRLYKSVTSRQQRESALGTVISAVQRLSMIIGFLVQNPELIRILREGHQATDAHLANLGLCNSIKAIESMCVEVEQAHRERQTPDETRAMVARLCYTEVKTSYKEEKTSK